MMTDQPPINGLKTALEYQGKEIDKLWREKASLESVRNIEQDVHDIREEVIAIRKGFTDRQEQERRERKANLKWMIGTVITSAMMIIAALALILPFLIGQ